MMKSEIKVAFKTKELLLVSNVLIPAKKNRKIINKFEKLKLAIFLRESREGKIWFIGLL